jgi:hypothetical protein
MRAATSSIEPWASITAIASGARPASAKNPARTPIVNATVLELVEWAGQPPGRRLQVDVEHEHEVGHDAAGRHRAHPADDLGIEAAGMTLVDDVRQQIAVRDHPVTAVERRSDDLGHELRPRRHVEEHLRRRGDVQVVAVEQDGPDRVAGRRRAGVAAGDYLPAVGPQPGHERCHLRRLPGAIHAVEGDEPAAAGRDG